MVHVDFEVLFFSGKLGGTVCVLHDLSENFHDM
jgi:hypothetical protein